MNPLRGNVLVVTDDHEIGDRLGRWISSAGEQPVLISGAERSLLERGDDERIDLVVTDLDPAAPCSRRLLERLLSGELFFAVPQLHLLRDMTLHSSLRELNPDVASISMGSPPEAGDFKARVRLAAEVGRLRRELARSTVHDELTGAFNRRYLLLRLSQEFARARRHRTSLSLALFDIDQLKSINDRYGLEVGDEAIRKVGRVLRSQVRTEDVSGRWGAKSFATILPGTPYRGGAVFANKVRGDAESFRVAVPDGSLQIKVSAGISSFHPRREMDSAGELVRHAEEALVEAKKRGGNRVYIDEAALRSERRLILIADSDPDLLDLSEDLLSMDDYRVLRAESVSTLMETLKYRRPDLLVLDLGMAEDPARPPLIEQIHALFPAAHLPIIGLSDRPGPSMQSLGRLAVDRYLTKPFSVSVLRALARDLVEQVRPEQPSPPPV